MKFGFDILFFAAIGLSSLGSFVLGEEKAQRLGIGVLLGSFAITQFSEPITKLVGSKVSFVDQFMVTIAIMVIAILICLLGKNVRDKKWPKSKIKAIVFGALSGMVAIAYVIAAMPSDLRTSLTTDYNLAALAYDLRLYLAGALVIWLLASYVTVGKAKN